MNKINCNRRKGTKTSSFGSGKREAHDSSTFYNSRMHKDLFSKPLSDDEIKDIVVPDVGEWADKVYKHTSEDMKDIPDNSIALAVTSPPYNASKDYDGTETLDEYLGLIERVGKEVYRVFKTRRQICNKYCKSGTKAVYTPSRFFLSDTRWIRLSPNGWIIWQKRKRC